MNKLKALWAEFKKFIARGNVVDMAVGVVIGSAFTAIVNAVTKGVLMPLVNWAVTAATGGQGLEGLRTILGTPVYIVDDMGTQVVDWASTLYIDWGTLGRLALGQVAGRHDHEVGPLAHLLAFHHRNGERHDAGRGGHHGSLIALSSHHFATRTNHLTEIARLCLTNHDAGRLGLFGSQDDFIAMGFSGVSVIMRVFPLMIMVMIGFVGMSLSLGLCVFVCMFMLIVSRSAVTRSQRNQQCACKRKRQIYFLHKLII